MSRAAIAFLCLRFAAIYLWIYAFVLVANAVPLILMRAKEPPQAWPFESGFYEDYLLIAPSLLSVLGIVLFVWAPELARRILSDPLEAQPENDSGIEGLALRLLGIYVLTLAFDYAPQLLSRMRFGQYTGEMTMLVAMLVMVVALTALGAWFLFFGPGIARWLLRASATTSGPSSRAQAIAFSVAGIFVLLGGLPDVVLGIVDVFSLKLDTSDDLHGLIAGERWRGETWVSVGRVILGIALFFGGRGLASMWNRLRSSGVAAARREPENRPG